MSWSEEPALPTGTQVSPQARQLLVAGKIVHVNRQNLGEHVQAVLGATESARTLITASRGRAHFADGTHQMIGGGRYSVHPTSVLTSQRLLIFQAKMFVSFGSDAVSAVSPLQQWPVHRRHRRRGSNRVRLRALARQ